LISHPPSSDASNGLFLQRIGMQKLHKATDITESKKLKKMFKTMHRRDVIKYGVLLFLEIVFFIHGLFC